MFGKNACVVVLFNDNQMLISVILWGDKKLLSEFEHRVKYGLDHWTLGPLYYFLD